MCLSDVGRVIAVDEVRRSARVEIGARTIEVSTVALGLDGPPVEAGGWLVVHTGLAVDRLSEHEARRILGARADLVTAARRREAPERYEPPERTGSEGPR